MRRPTEVSASFPQARTSDYAGQKNFGGQPTPQTQTTPHKHKKSGGGWKHKQKNGGGGADPKRINTPTTLKETVGSALLSHNPPVAVPSAQKGLTSRFGKDTGCNPLAKTTNTTNKQHPKQGRNPPVSETIIHLTTQPTNPLRIRGRVGREPHSGRKHPQKQTTNQNQSMKYC